MQQLSEIQSIGTKHEWRHPLLDLPTTLIIRNVVQLFSIATYYCSWQVQQGMAPLVLCPYTYYITKNFLGRVTNSRARIIILGASIMYLAEFNFIGLFDILG